MTIKAGLFIFLFMAFALFSAKVKHELRADNSPLDKLKVGQAMPDFTLPNRSGGSLKLSETLSGRKVVMINFWASWCGPCRIEMPGFDKLYAAKNKDGFVILGVNEDEERADMEKYLRQRPVTFPILVDPNGELMKKLGIRALPTTVLVGADGKVKGVYEGVQEYLDFTVEGLLKPDPSPSR